MRDWLKRNKTEIILFLVGMSIIVGFLSIVDLNYCHTCHNFYST